MRLAGSHDDVVRSSVLDLSAVSLQTLQREEISPVLSEVLKRYLAPSSSISPFQSYLDDTPDSGTLGSFPELVGKLGEIRPSIRR